jgi:hypothetical protein
MICIKISINRIFELIMYCSKRPVQVIRNDCRYVEKEMKEVNRIPDDQSVFNIIYI